MRYITSTLVLFLTLVGCLEDDKAHVVLDTTGATERLLSADPPYEARDWCDIYLSIMEIKDIARQTPDFQIYFISEWRRKVDLIQESNRDNRFGIHGELVRLKSIDYDMIARGQWFPEDFRVQKEDLAMLKLHKQEVFKIMSRYPER